MGGEKMCLLQTVPTIMLYALLNVFTFCTTPKYDQHYFLGHGRIFRVRYFKRLNVFKKGFFGVGHCFHKY